MPQPNFIPIIYFGVSYDLVLPLVLIIVLSILAIIGIASYCEKAKNNAIKAKEKEKNNAIEAKKYHFKPRDNYEIMNQCPSCNSFFELFAVECPICGTKLKQKSISFLGYDNDLSSFHVVENRVPHYMILKKYLVDNHESISIPGSWNGVPITEIGSNAFSNTKNLKKVFIEDGIKIIGAEAFSNSSVEFVRLPNTLEIISFRAFENSKLKSIYFPFSLQEIYNAAFSNCDIKSLYIPPSVKKVGHNCFFGCKKLEYVHMSKVENIDVGAFDGCDLKSIFLPNSLVSIGRNAFAHNDNLKIAILGNKVEIMGVGAFAECQNLSLLYVPPTLSTILSKYENEPIWYSSKETTSRPGSTYKTWHGPYGWKYETSVYTDTKYKYESKLIVYGVLGSYSERYFSNNDHIEFRHFDGTLEIAKYVKATDIVKHDVDLINNYIKRNAPIIKELKEEYVDENIPNEKHKRIHTKLNHLSHACYRLETLKDSYNR